MFQTSSHKSLLSFNQIKESAWFNEMGRLRVWPDLQRTPSTICFLNTSYSGRGAFLGQRGRLIWRFLAFSWNSLKSNVHIHHPQNISDLKLGRNSHSSKYMLHLTMGNMHSMLETCLLKGRDRLENIKFKKR